VSQSVLDEAVRLFNNHYFWECHELLEDEWLEEIGDRKRFLQGVIQAAAAFYHVLNNNVRGFDRLAQEALKKLQIFPDLYEGLELSPLRASLNEFIFDSQEIQAQRKENFDILKIVQLKRVSSVTNSLRIKKDNA